MFNSKKETENIIKFIQDYYQKNNLGGVIIGISGGKDSAVVSALFVKAIGKENVIGVTLPCNSNPKDKEDAQKVSERFGFELINFNLNNIYKEFKKELTKLGNFTKEETKNSDINIKPRLRMVTLYYLSALYSKIKGKTYLVAGTSNKSEIYVGYYTKGGDSVCDISPIADLTVNEVIKIGENLKVPKEILYKTPCDGLSNISDEEKLGITYNAIENFLNNNQNISKEETNKIKKLHNKNIHKQIIPVYRKK